MAVITGVGHHATAAFRRNTNSWGGAALALGAGHGLEIEGHSLKPAAELIRNNALGFGVSRGPGVGGNKKVDGDIGPCNFYYRGLETLIALVMGTAGTPSTLASGAYLHLFKIANTDAGYFVTFAADPFADSTAPIHEYPCVKLTGFKIDFKAGGKGMITFQGVAHNVNFNTGAPITNRVVTSVAVADGTYTIANQPATPSPLTITVTDANASITEHVITFVGTDRDDNVISEVYTLSADGLTWTSRKYWKTITSVTGSATAGTVGGSDTVVIGVSNGVNNSTSVASITYPSERDFVLFSQLDSALFNVQSAGALTAATASGSTDNDEYYPTGLSIQVSLGHSNVFSSKFGNLVNEPVRGGSSFAEVTVGLNFAEYDSRNHLFLLKQMEDNKGKLKGSLTFQGGYIGATAYRHALRFFLNNLQVNTGAPTMSGPGLMPFDIELFAQKALSTPTGFTSGYTDPVTIEMQTSLSTNALA